MTRFPAAALALLLSGTACAGPEANQTMPIQRITRAVPETTLALPAARRGRVVIEVTRVDNPGGVAVTLVVTGETAEPLARFALYPPDKPARFAVRVPEGVTRLRVALEAKGEAPPLIELRVAAP